jgi:hypothetical protein
MAEPSRLYEILEQVSEAHSADEIRI